jgi:cytochrome c oxidase assembly protein Cox11
MNNLKRTFNKNKKSVFSLLVALVLMLSFNYAPISLVADRIKTTNAYKATSTQSYYSTASNKRIYKFIWI